MGCGQSKQVSSSLCTANETPAAELDRDVSDCARNVSGLDSLVKEDSNLAGPAEQPSELLAPGAASSTQAAELQAVQGYVAREKSADFVVDDNLQGQINSALEKTSRCAENPSIGTETYEQAQQLYFLSEGRTSSKQTLEEQESASVDLLEAQKLHALFNRMSLFDNSSSVSCIEAFNLALVEEELAALEMTAFDNNQLPQLLEEDESVSKLVEQEMESLDMKEAQMLRALLKVGLPSDSPGDVMPNVDSSLSSSGKDDEQDKFATSSGRVRERVTQDESFPVEQPQSIFWPYSGTQAERDAISCVEPGRLYLTNWRGASRAEALEALGVRHIVCVNEQENEHADRFDYFNIDTLEDQEDHDARQHFSDVADYTERALARGGAVCFHCAAGISRSSTMLIAYLMAVRAMPLREAFAMVYTARRVTWPNRAFMRQLIDYEAALQAAGRMAPAGPSLTLDEWDAWTAYEPGEGEKLILP